MSFTGIKVPFISAFMNGDELVILHKGSDTLLIFRPPEGSTEKQIVDAINTSMGGLDWDKHFEEVFRLQKYRKAVIGVIDLLIKD